MCNGFSLLFFKTDFDKKHKKKLNINKQLFKSFIFPLLLNNL